MVKVCIVNDTSEWYHWGCNGSSLGLLGLVERTLQPTGVAIVPITVTYADSYLPDSAVTAQDPRAAIEFLKTWVAAPLLLEASDIVIHGEGTIHGKSPGARRLLYVAYICSAFLGKRVHIVNHSMFPPLDDPDAVELYRLAYRSAHFVAVRESDSARIARETLGCDPVIAFDCLPLTLEHTTIGPRRDMDDYAIITGTSGMNDANLAILKAGAQLLSQQGLRLVWLIGAPKHPAVDEMTQAMTYAAEIGAQIANAESLEDWARWIRDAKFMFSGRFHYVIARLCLGGPFATFGGNTPKIAALLRDQALPGLLIAAEEETAAIIALASQTPMPACVTALAEAASANLGV